MSEATAGRSTSSGAPLPEALPGGGFLVAPVPRSVFCREMLGEEVGMFVDTAEKFWKERVLTQIDAIERKDTVTVDGEEIPLGVQLLRESAELGLLSLDIQEEYGGLEMDKITSFRVCECFAGCASQAATNGAHSGIGTLPIVYFGNDDQKKRYLEKLGSGELVSCYGLTEPGSGSDALSGRTVARLAEDGSHYLISGEKLYITNGGWADVGIVFARLDGKYSAFIVDLHQDTVTRGIEEQKMGIKGSSTTTLAFDETVVPLENMLGKPGDATTIALNILYLGRLKLGVASMGSCKYVIDKTVKFGKERKQFGQPVITFEMQKAKLADMVVRTFAVDSMCYRMIGQLEEELSELEPGPNYERDQIEVMRRFGPETSIVKIAGSETLMRVANHGVRMHGGYGFCQEYHVERVMRDNVIDTIFEGTNDVNRMVCFGDTVKNVYGGAIPFREALEAIHRDLRKDRLEVSVEDSPLAEEERQLVALKRSMAYTLEQALIGIGKDVRVEQQVMSEFSTAMMELYNAESSWGRIHHLLTEGVGPEYAEVLRAVLQLAIENARSEAGGVCRRILSHVTSGPTGKQRAGDLERLLAQAQPSEPLDVFGANSRVAEYVIDAGKYPF